MRLIQKVLTALLIVWSISFWSCDAITPADDGNLADYTCEGCHTTRTMLTNVIGALNLEPPVEEEAAPG